MSDQRTIGGAIPRGVEVLINKAAIDTEFKALLLNDTREAAKVIALELTSPEEFLLRAIPCDQLEVIIEKTVVPEEHRSAFLGMTAKVMLLALATMALNSCYQPATTGMAPEKPKPLPTKTVEEPAETEKPAEVQKPEKLPVTDGIRPDRPQTRGIRPDRPFLKPKEPTP